MVIFSVCSSFATYCYTPNQSLTSPHVVKCRLPRAIYLLFTFNNIQYIPRNMHTVFALLCFVVVIHWLIFPYPSGLLHWHCGNLTIVPVPAKQPWWIWINTSCEFIINDWITTTKQSTTKPCAYFLGCTVHWRGLCNIIFPIKYAQPAVCSLSCCYMIGSKRLHVKI